MARLEVGTDDLPDAYRGLPVCDQHMAFSAVAIYVPDHGWRFSPLHGLAYGLESAVVHFNRLPQLGVAAARRLFLERLAMFCAIIEVLRHVYRPICSFGIETSVFHKFCGFCFVM